VFDVKKWDTLRQGETGAWVGIIGNLVMAVVKISVGLVAGSQVMLADGVHSISDLFGSAAVLVGLRVARRPPDGCHPYGHARAESIAAKLVGIFLLLAGLQVGYSALATVWAGVIETPDLLALWTALVSVVVKETLFWYKVRLGERIGSRAVVANAWEHRSDALSSVVALVGIAGARMGYPLLDPIGALVVSVFILGMGWKFVREATDRLMDGAVEESLLRLMKRVVRGVRGVEEVQDLRARYMGPMVLVDVKIGVNQELSLSDAHEVAHRVKDTLMAEVKQVSDAMVHVDPVEPGVTVPHGTKEGAEKISL